MGERRPTNFPNGVGNTRSQILQQFPQLDPTKIVCIFDDFTSDITGRWDVVETQGGATQDIVAGHGGLIALVNTAGDNDINLIRSPHESFLLSKAKRSWFRTRLKISAVADTEIFAGLAVATDDDPFAGGLALGMGFHVPDAATSVCAFHMKDTGTAYAKTTGLHTFVADTFVELGWYYDGRGKLTLYVNDVPTFVVPDITEYPDSEEVALVLGVKAGTTSARTLTCDFILAATER